LGSVENKSHENTNAITTACLSNINEKAPPKPIVQTYKPNNRKRQPRPMSEFLEEGEALEFVQRHYEGLQGFRKSLRRCMWGTSRPAPLAFARMRPPTFWAKWRELRLNAMFQRSTRRSPSTPPRNPVPRRDVTKTKATFSGARNESGPPDSYASAAYRVETLVAAARAQSSREPLGRVRPTLSCLRCAAIGRARCDPW
jgi:hypothetical protein